MDFPYFDKLWITLTVAAFLGAGRYILQAVGRPFVIKHVLPDTDKEGNKTSEEEQQGAAKKIIDHWVDAAVYSFFVWYGWEVCKNEEWFPAYFGGHGEAHKAFSNVPFVKINPDLVMFGFCNFGYRVEQLVTHLLTSNEADFEEMLLHDLATNALFFGYLSSNLVPVGTMIAWLHDLTDIPFHLAKSANNSYWPDLAPFPFIFGQLMWIYFRLGCFAHLIYTTYNV